MDTWLHAGLTSVQPLAQRTEAQQQLSQRIKALQSSVEGRMEGMKSNPMAIFASELHEKTDKKEKRKNSQLV